MTMQFENPDLTAELKAELISEPESRTTGLLARRHLLSFRTPRSGDPESSPDLRARVWIPGSRPCGRAPE
jgi:hypothetical protein